MIGGYIALGCVVWGLLSVGWLLIFRTGYLADADIEQLFKNWKAGNDDRTTA